MCLRNSGIADSSPAMAIWRWCPGMPSWNAIASSSNVPHAVGSVTLTKKVPPRLPSDAGGK